MGNKFCKFRIYIDFDRKIFDLRFLNQLYIVLYPMIFIYFDFDNEKKCVPRLVIHLIHLIQKRIEFYQLKIGIVIFISRTTETFCLFHNFTQLFSVVSR